MTMPSVHYLAILPFLIVSGTALVLLVASALTKARLSTPVASGIAVTASSVAALIGIFQALYVGHHGATHTLAGAVVLDGFSVAMGTLVTVSLALALLTHVAWAKREGLNGAEYQMLALLAASGAMLMTCANDLIVVFLGLEILSIGLYVQISYYRRRRITLESAMKYFLLGGFISAVFVYGAALVYGATGSTNLTTISYFLATNTPLKVGLLLGGAALMMATFAFKTKQAPFHFWAPDVYQGAPAVVAGFQASVVWAGAYAALIRVMLSALGTQLDNLRPIFVGLIVLSMVVGALSTMTQSVANRLLAYSSIVHTGFIMLGVWAASPRGVASSVFYVLTYAPVAIATFAIVSLVDGPGDARGDLSNYRGLARRNPVLASAFALLLLSQLGVPLTVGFVAKFNALAAVIDQGGAWMAVVAMLAAATAAVAYLRWATSLFASEPALESALDVPLSTKFVVAIGVAVTLIGGVDPTWFAWIAQHASLAYLP